MKGSSLRPFQTNYRLGLLYSVMGYLMILGLSIFFGSFVHSFFLGMDESNGVVQFQRDVERSFVELQSYQPLDAIPFADYSIDRIKSHYRLVDFEYTSTLWPKKIDAETLALVLESSTIMNKEKEIKILLTDVQTRDAVFYKDSGWLHHEYVHERYLFVYDQKKKKTGILYVHYSVKKKGVYGEVNDLLTLTFHNVKLCISSWEYYTQMIPPYFVAISVVLLTLLSGYCLFKIACCK